MISYSFEYTPGSRPQAIKTMTAASGETFSVNIFYEHVEDRSTFTTAQTYEHLENLLLYIKEITPKLSLIHIDEENDGDGWHLNGGWAEVAWANNEILRWWEFVYYNELPIVQNEGESTS